MVTGNWLNNDNLWIKYGTSLATPTTTAEYNVKGQERVIETLIDLTTLTTTAPSASNTAAFLGDTTFFGSTVSSSIIISRVELTVETAATTSSSATLKVGLCQNDRATVPSNYDHAIINAETQANMATVGDTLVYVGSDSIPAGSTHGGTLIGSSPTAATAPYYLTAQTGTGTFTAGKVRVRIFYHGIGTITY